MSNQIKSVLSKLAIASIKNKSTVTIKEKKNLFNLLIFLWEKGYILGYTLTNKNCYTIFLKPTCAKNSALVSEFWKNKYISYNDSKKLTFLQKNSVYLIKTQLGIVSIKFCKKKGLGGELVSKF